MDLQSNMLFEWVPADVNASGPPLVERVLDFDKSTDEVVAINIFDEGAFPVLRSYRLIEDSHKAGALTILERDPFAAVMIAENKINPKHRKFRDTAWNEIAPLLQHDDAEFMVYAWKRGPLIEKHRLKSGRPNSDGTFTRLSHATIYKRLNCTLD